MTLLCKLKAIHNALAVAAILFGLWLLLRPDTSAVLLCRLLGLCALAVGAAKIAGYFSDDPYRLAFQFDFALGVFTLLTGAFLLFRTGSVLRFLPLLIGLYIVVESVFRLQGALDARRFGLRSWWVLLLAALVTGVFGALLLFAPFGSRLLTQACGLAILISGVASLIFTCLTVHISKKNDNIIEGDFTVR